ncbi:hypothetical protein EV361DRAFT_975090 [Lentinula raphanica]|nr:hypothetical protein EV361DRAFT_975090 [Lentinula raphanica]
MLHLFLNDSLEAERSLLSFKAMVFESKSQYFPCSPQKNLFYLHDSFASSSLFDSSAHLPPALLPSNQHSLVDQFSSSMPSSLMPSSSLASSSIPSSSLASSSLASSSLASSSMPRSSLPSSSLPSLSLPSSSLPSSSLPSSACVSTTVASSSLSM